MQLLRYNYCKSKTYDTLLSTLRNNNRINKSFNNKNAHTMKKQLMTTLLIFFGTFTPLITCGNNNSYGGSTTVPTFYDGDRCDQLQNDSHSLESPQRNIHRETIERDIKTIGRGEITAFFCIIAATTIICTSLFTT